MQTLGAVALVVRDYDEAIAYYTGVLGFTLVEDSPRGAGKRWVLVAPPGATETRLLLAQAKNEDELAAVGRQTGGRVFLFLHTDDFWRDHRAYTARGVRFIESPREESYATVVVFEDLYGNRWDLLQMRKKASTPDLPAASLLPDFAAAPWYRDFRDHRCPHDGWLENLEISEPAAGSRREQRSTAITIKLLGAYHDGHIVFRYTGVHSYSLPGSAMGRGHGDWHHDEFSVNADDRLVHDIIWALGPNPGCCWRIEAANVTYEWFPETGNH